MARKIRFPLKMTNGTEVRTIEELRANFDLTAVLGYYADGKLVTWLRDRYLDSEADKIEALDKDSKSFQSDLCAALGVELPSGSDEADGELDMDYINRRNEKKRILRTITDDEEIIYKVDQVALDQDDLFDIYDEGKKEIYLCQGEFEIPLSVTDVTYIGVADPIVTVRVTDNVNFKEKNIKFVDCVYGWDVSNTTPLDDMRKAENLFLKGDYKKAIEILDDCAKTGNPRANAILLEIDDIYYSYKDPKYRIAIESGWEICGINGKYSRKDETCKIRENHLYIAKKLADKGDWLCEYEYAILLRRKSDLDIQHNLDEVVKYFKSSAGKGNFMAYHPYLFNLYFFDKKAVFKNDEEILNFISQYAESGEPLAQMELYYVYCLENHGVEVDYKKSIEWLTKAAENGLPRAQYELGSEYLDGSGYKGVEKNIAKAIEWLTKSAEQGDLNSHRILGDHYYETENYREAVKWYSKYFDKTDGLKNRHDAHYAYRLGECYYYGNGVAQDYSKAFEMFKSIEAVRDDGDNSAEYLLGEAYFNGNGVAQNKTKAIEFYVKSSTYEARYKLAEIYYYGDGAKVDYEQTFKWLSVNDWCPFSKDKVIKFEKVFEKIEEAAETGNAEKQYELGFCYHYGIGIEHDYDLAREWIRKAAENGNSKALYRLVEYHWYDKTEEAIEYLEKSAQKGYIKAMEKLGDWYYFSYGDDIEKDCDNALKWYTMAAEHGADVASRIEDIKREMNEEVTL